MLKFGGNHGIKIPIEDAPVDESARKDIHIIRLFTQCRSRYNFVSFLHLFILKFTFLSFLHQPCETF